MIIKNLKPGYVCVSIESDLIMVIVSTFRHDNGLVTVTYFDKDGITTEHLDEGFVVSQWMLIVDHDSKIMQDPTKMERRT